MNVYVVLTDYLDSNFFGVYSSFEKAQTAIFHFIEEDDNIVACNEIENGFYEIVARNGCQYNIEIHWDVLDEDCE